MEPLATIVFTTIVLFVGAIIYGFWYYKPKDQQTEDHLEEFEPLSKKMERHFTNTPELKAMADEEGVYIAIAQAVYNLRARALLSQEDVAKLVGCSAEDIESLEMTDYTQGCPLCLYLKIATAIGVHKPASVPQT